MTVSFLLGVVCGVVGTLIANSIAGAIRRASEERQYVRGGRF